MGHGVGGRQQPLGALISLAPLAVPPSPSSSSGLPAVSSWLGLRTGPSRNEVGLLCASPTLRRPGQSSELDFCSFVIWRFHSLATLSTQGTIYMCVCAFASALSRCHLQADLCDCPPGSSHQPRAFRAGHVWPWVCVQPVAPGPRQQKPCPQQ